MIPVIWLLIVFKEGLCEFILNPYCTDDTRCNSTSFVDSVAQSSVKNGNIKSDVIFWRGGAHRLPSITFLHSHVNQSINLNWSCLLADQCNTTNCGYLNSSSTSISSGFTIFFSDIEYSDGNSSSLKDILDWNFVISPKSATLMSECNKTKLNCKDRLRINITVRLESLDHDSILPRLTNSNDSVLIDISMIGRNNEDFSGMTCAILPLWAPTKGKVTADTAYMVNDEQMPGVFKQQRLFLKPHVQLRWKPIAFTSRNRMITQWVGMNMQNPKFKSIPLDEFIESDLHLPICPQLALNQTSQVYMINFTFDFNELDKIDVSKNDRVISWTLAVGYNFPRTLKDQFSIFTILIFGIGWSIPIIIILVTQLIVLPIIVPWRSTYFKEIITTTAYREINEN